MVINAPPSVLLGGTTALILDRSAYPTASPDCGVFLKLFVQKGLCLWSGWYEEVGQRIWVLRHDIC
jgi:hypothetical protein